MGIKIWRNFPIDAPNGYPVSQSKNEVSNFTNEHHCQKISVIVDFLVHEFVAVMKNHYQICIWPVEKQTCIRRTTVLELALKWPRPTTSRSRQVWFKSVNDVASRQAWRSGLPSRNRYKSQSKMLFGTNLRKLIYWTTTKTSMHQSKILRNKPGGRWSSENWFGGRTASRCPSACSAAGFPSCPGAQSHWSWRTLASPRTWGRCRKASERRQDFGKNLLA